MFPNEDKTIKMHKITMDKQQNLMRCYLEHHDEFFERNELQDL